MIQWIKKKLPHNFFLRRWWSLCKAKGVAIKNNGTCKSFTVIGITGTDGKTSTTHFTTQLLHTLGYKVAMMSSDRYFLNGRWIDNITKRTSASPQVTYDFLKKAKEAKATHVVLEVSSHALEQGRYMGMHFDYVMITNLAQEHLDYHKTMEKYAKSKSKLFFKAQKACIMPHDLLHKSLFTRVAKVPCVQIAVGEHVRDQTDWFVARQVETTVDGSDFTIYYHDKMIPDVHLPILGTYNVNNTMLAVAAIKTMHKDVSDRELKEAIGTLEPVPGRLDKLDLKQKFGLWISFAVTPQALESVLQTAQAVKGKNGKVIIVYGATGGQHDRLKRPLMGEVTGKYADLSVLTDDETYGEDSLQILQEIEPGLQKSGGQYHIESDRRLAIRYALEQAQDEDIIVVTGLGNFNSRNMGEEEPWNDVQVITEEVKKL